MAESYTPGILCNYGYRINIDEYPKNLISAVTNDLLIIPKTDEGYTQPSMDNAIKVFLRKDNFMYLPKFYGRKKFGMETNNNHGNNAEEMGDLTFNKKNFVFTERQRAIINATLKGLHDHSGGILRAGVGAGKSVISLYCAKKFGLRTLILVPRVDLRTQWYKEIERAFENAVICVIEKVEDIDNATDADFIIMTMHYYAGHKWPMNFLTTIGMIIIDEVHLFATKQFSKCFTKYCPKYILALSATSLRIDRLDVMINYFCGESLYSDNFQHNNRIHAIILNWSLKLHARDEVQKYNSAYNYGIPHVHTICGKSRANHSQMVADITENPIRNRKIVNLAIALANGFLIDHDSGSVLHHSYRTLVVSNRIDHLQKLRRMILTKDPDASTGLLIGSMKEEESAESKTKKILLGNLQCVRDGLSITDLDALVIAVPIKNTPIEDEEGNTSEAWKQLIGRILRREHKKPIFLYYIADNYGHFRMHTNTVKEFLTRNSMVTIHHRKLTRETQEIPLYSHARKTIPMLYNNDGETESDNPENSIKDPAFWE
jgi:superfamily II DNA or RNA helicase